MSMLAYILQVSICMGVFYLFYHFALRRETFFQTNRLYLLTTLLLSMLLPLVRIYIKELQSAPEVFQAPLIVGYYLDEFQQVAPVETASFPWMKILLVCYLGGVLFLSVKFMSSLFSIWRIKRHASLIYIEKKPCYISSKIQCPFSFFNSIFLPVDHSFTEKELQEVISHEYAHVDSGHSWDVVLMELSIILFWPSPIIYFYKKSIREIHEYMADAAVLKETPWESYAAMLVSQKQRGLQMQLSNQLIFSQLKKRLLMMNQKPSPNSSNWKYVGLIPILLITVLIFSFRQKDRIPAGSTQPEITMDSTGQTFINGQLVTLTELSSILKRYTGNLDPIYVRVDQKASTGKLGELNDLADSLDVRLSFVPGDFNHIITSRSPHISIGAINIPPGSVQVRVGDQLLKEDIDYIIDYTIGHIEIINETYLQPQNTSLHVSFNESFSDKLSINPTVYVQYAEEMPSMPSCALEDTQEKFDCTMKELFDFIYKNLKYPEADKINKVEGHVIAQFIIDTNGKMKEILVKRSKSTTMTAEVIRVLELMAASTTWIPAKNDGEPVNLLYTLPVKFTLQPTQSENPDKENKNNIDGKLNPLGQLSPLNSTLNQLDPLASTLNQQDSLKSTLKPLDPPAQPILTDCASLTTISEQEKCSMDRIFRFLYEHLRYPQEDRDNNVEGTAFVQLTIGINGELSDVEVKRFPSETIKAELIRLFALMKTSLKWIPAGKDSYQFVLPVKFVLQNGQKKNDEFPEPKYNVTTVTALPSNNPSQEIKTFSVRPNPAIDEIAIELYDGAQLVVVHDANGKEVLSVKVPEGTVYTYSIDISKLATGLYTAQLIGKDEKRVAKFSIVR